MRLAAAVLVALCVTSRVEGQDVFVRGTDGAPWTTSVGGDWRQLDGVLTSGVDACASGSVVHLVGRGSDNAVWANSRRDATWTGWRSLGGETASDPAVACDTTGRVTVFVRGTDGALWHRPAAEGGTWSSLGGVVDGGPDAAAGGEGITVVAKGTDGAAWVLAQRSGRWAPWRSLGGVLTSDPSIVADAGDDLIFARGADQALWSASLRTGAWTKLGGTLGGGPDAAAGGGGVFVVARGTDGAAWSFTRRGGAWGGWTALGGQVVGDPGVVWSGSATVVAVAAGSGGAVTAVPPTQPVVAVPAARPGDDTARGGQAVLGRLHFAWDCAAPDMQDYNEEIAFHGRVAAISPAFEACLDRDLIASYRKCTGDPHYSLSIGEQARAALAVSRSANDLHVTCSGAGDGWARAQIGTHGRAGSEAFQWGRFFTDTYNALNAASCDSVQDALGCRPSEYPWPYADAAGIVWHEAMHQHGYVHGADDQEAAAPACGYGSDPSWNFRANSMPYLVGNCITNVLNQSHATCGGLRTCADPNQLKIAGPDGTCSCVADPGQRRPTSGAPAPPRLALHTINAASFGCETTPRPRLMRDGDQICMTEQPPTNDPLNVRITLLTDAKITWWKEIKLFDQAGREIQAVWTQAENAGPNSMMLNVNVARVGYLVFSKAKFLGAHTGVYQIRGSDLATGTLAGRHFLFTWMKE